VGVPLKGGRVKIMIVLHALALLDQDQTMVMYPSTYIQYVLDTYSQQLSYVARAKQNITPLAPGRMLKRKVGYGCDIRESLEIAEARKRMNEMSMESS
jgi:hypothetical protein